MKLKPRYRAFDIVFIVTTLAVLVMLIYSVYEMISRLNDLPPVD